MEKSYMKKLKYNWKKNYSWNNNDFDFYIQIWKYREKDVHLKFYQKMLEEYNFYYGIIRKKSYIIIIILDILKKWFLQKKYINKNKFFWNIVIFSDENKFNIINIFHFNKYNYAKYNK